MVVTVVDLSTGEEQVFMSLPPSEAVIRAYLRRNTTFDEHTYPSLYAKHYPDLVWGKRTVAMGNFCAKRSIDA